MYKNKQVAQEYNPCPCESGWQFPDCCGLESSENYRIFGELDNPNNLSIENTAKIENAINNMHETPDLFPVKLSLKQKKVHYVKMSPHWYNKSIFIDPERIAGSYGLSADLDQLAYICDQIAPNNSPFIFHTAFCGSTLLSRALAEIYECLPIREPQAINDLYQFVKDKQSDDKEISLWLSRIIAILSRRYHPYAPSIIKANDYANGLMMSLLKHSVTTPVLFMYTPLSEFLASCLKAENRRQWIKSRYQYCKSPVADLLNIPVQDMMLTEENVGEMAAIYWIYNILLFENAYDQHPNNLFSLDFNHMLDNPIDCLETCADLFSLEPKKSINVSEELEWLLSVYSKDSIQDYSPDRRQKDIQQTLSENKHILKNAEGFARNILAERYPVFTLRGGLTNQAD